MKIAFTICSNNYLAQAKTLGDSLLQHNPDHTFVIFLVDTLSPEIDYNFFKAFEMIPVDRLFPGDFDKLWKKYDIVELNTCVKPTCFKFLFQRNEAVDHVFYMDPDIMLFSSLAELEKNFTDSNILLTPHITTPIDIDDKFPLENHFLNYGIYNLGFLGLKRSREVMDLLDWWEKRTLLMGFIRPQQGIFVDQLWMNLVPIFFNGAKVLKEFGYNAAPWNLHERYEIKKIKDRYVMKDDSVLCFYHFSNYQYKEPGRIARSYNRVSLTTSPVVEELYRTYQEKIIANKIGSLSQVACTYVEKHRVYKKKNTPAAQKLKRFVKTRLYSLNDWYNSLFRADKRVQD